MVKDSEQSAAADKERREKVDLKNQSDSLCYQSEKQLEELKAKLSSEDVEIIKVSIQELKTAVESDRYEDMKVLSKKLQDQLMEMGKKVYTNSGTGTKPESSGSDSVIDANFSETK